MSKEVAPERPFLFKVVANKWQLPTDIVYGACLVENNWDDYGYSTLHNLFVFDAAGVSHEIGWVKIGKLPETIIEYTTKLPRKFDKLDVEFFSLGQADTYYENLNKLGVEIREKVLNGLQDVVSNMEQWKKVCDLEVTSKSLLRGVNKETVETQLRRIALGGVRLTDYHFTYTLPEEAERSEISLTFDVIPNMVPPTNIHVLIGHNGAGKTYILNSMTKALVLGDSEKVGVFEQENSDEVARPFANLVSVAFSAFDPFLAIPETAKTATGIRYSYIGLKNTAAGESFGAPKHLETLTDEFVESLDNCFKSLIFERWRNAVKVLEVDRNFKDKGFSSLAFEGLKEIPRGLVRDMYAPLSSGHKIVLLTITRLVEKVEERSLILLDEPESHLHPPLLSAFIRSLSDLLIDRNGVAIIATHSPVVLQEVPKSCVWKLRRSGREVQITRPDMETFGENVSVLTRDTFRLEVENSGFHKMLKDVAEREDSFGSAVKFFNDALGAEARAILRAMYAEKKPNDLEI